MNSQNTLVSSVFLPALQEDPDAAISLSYDQGELVDACVSNSNLEKYIEEEHAYEISDPNLVSANLEKSSVVIHVAASEVQAEIKSVYIWDTVESLPDIQPQTSVDKAGPAPDALPAALPEMFVISSEGEISQAELLQALEIDHGVNHSKIDDDPEGDLDLTDFLDEALGEYEDLSLFLVDHKSSAGDVYRSLISQSRAPEMSTPVMDFLGAKKISAHENA